MFEEATAPDSLAARAGDAYASTAVDSRTYRDVAVAPDEEAARRRLWRGIVNGLAFSVVLWGLLVFLVMLFL